MGWYKEEAACRGRERLEEKDAERLRQIFLASHVNTSINTVYVRVCGRCSVKKIIIIIERSMHTN